MSTKICVSLTSRDTEQASGELARAARWADLVELRLDYMAEFDLPRLLSERPCSAIVTNRPVREGGMYEGDEAQRVAPLRQAVALGTEHVDIEHDAVQLLGETGEVKLIISQHDFDCTPPDLDGMLQRLTELGADIPKIAVMPHDIGDAVRVLEALRNCERPAICLAMGPLGLATRLLAGRYGGYLSFATLGTGPVSGPGQPTAQAMKQLYRADRVGPETLVTATFAPDAALDDSVCAINAIYGRLSLDAVHVPLPANERGEALFEAVRALDVRGFLLGEPWTEAIGRVKVGKRADTLWREGTKWRGAWLKDDLAPAERLARQVELWTGADCEPSLAEEVLRDCCHQGED